MSWDNFVGAVAKHIPGTTTSRINKINSLAENPAAVSALEQSRVAAGHVMGRAAGGAVIGAGLNGYEYSQTGSGFGGSYSMAESVISGAIAGAIGGGVIGGLGAKAAAKKAVANVDASNKKIAKLTDKLTYGRGNDYRKLKKEARAARKNFQRDATQENLDAYQDAKIKRKVSGEIINDQINSYKNFNSSAQLNAQATKRMRTHIFSKPING